MHTRGRWMVVASAVMAALVTLPASAAVIEFTTYPTGTVVTGERTEENPLTYETTVDGQGIKVVLTADSPFDFWDIHESLGLGYDDGGTAADFENWIDNDTRDGLSDVDVVTISFLDDTDSLVAVDLGSQGLTAGLLEGSWIVNGQTFTAPTVLGGETGVSTITITVPVNADGANSSATDRLIIQSLDVAAIPEPASLTLLGLGGLGALLRRRRA